MGDVNNQAAAIFGYQGAGTDWFIVGDRFIWFNTGGTLNTIGITVDASALEAGDVLVSATVSIPWGGQQQVGANYEWRVQAEASANPAVFAAARLPRTVTLRATEVTDSVGAAQTGTYNLDITALIADLFTTYGPENIGNVNLVISAVTQTDDFVSWTGTPTLNIDVGAGAPVINDVDSDNAVFNGQTDVVINCANAGDGTGQSRVRVNSQADGLGADIVQTLGGAWSATSITIQSLNLTGLSGTASVFIRDNAGNENATGFAITIETPGVISIRGANNDWARNNQVALANQSGITVDVYNVSTGVRILRVTNHTTDASALLADIVSASILTGTDYRLIADFGGGVIGLYRSVTAT